MENTVAIAIHEGTRISEECDQAVTEANSLRMALEEEQKRLQQEKESYKEAIEKAGASAIESFMKSESYNRDLGELTLPNFMIGYTSAVNEVGLLLSQEGLDSFKAKDSYNEDVKELCDCVAARIQEGRILAEVREEFNQ